MCSTVYLKCYSSFTCVDITRATASQDTTIIPTKTVYRAVSLVEPNRVKLLSQKNEEKERKKKEGRIVNIFYISFFPNSLVLFINLNVLFGSNIPL